ncbi:hypothetical protein QYE76_013298 [Lolium multiflorum]|uniref:Uncharacterized protein n=1 Tax=Lolium multiflorum TaxID=4521 RepID=A0AAD8X4Q2_LOLMU|nr:hypothetical protein QYE76_013298 [Lolium multiflorum]
MLGIGFEPQTRKIVDEIPRSRQTLMYTANWPKEVTKISGDLSRDPIQINIGNIDELAANNPSHSMQRCFHQWISNAVWSRFLELPSCGTVVVLVLQAFMVINHRVVVGGTAVAGRVQQGTIKTVDHVEIFGLSEMNKPLQEQERACLYFVETFTCSHTSISVTLGLGTGS